MATVEEVEAILRDLAGRLDRIDPAYRALLPSRRTILARCPDLGVAYHASWRGGRLGELVAGEPDGRADIRVAVDSDDLVALYRGELPVARAIADDRLRLDASMTDLLRLRTVL